MELRINLVRLVGCVTTVVAGEVTGVEEARVSRVRATMGKSAT